MDLDKLKVRRSFIFTPGLRPEMFPKALVSVSYTHLRAHET